MTTTTTIEVGCFGPQWNATGDNNRRRGRKRVKIARCWQCVDNATISNVFWCKLVWGPGDAHFSYRERRTCFGVENWWEREAAGRQKYSGRANRGDCEQLPAPPCRAFHGLPHNISQPACCAGLSRTTTSPRSQSPFRTCKSRETIFAYKRTMRIR